MTYIERLAAIQRMNSREALEAILSEAANASLEETAAKLFSGALLLEADTRYGEAVMPTIARVMDIKRSTAYERRSVVGFYGQFSACADILDACPTLRYSHFRHAMRYGKKFNSEDPAIQQQAAIDMLHYAADQAMSTTEFGKYIQQFIKPDGNQTERVGLFVVQAITIDADGSGITLRLTGEDLDLLRTKQHQIVSAAVYAKRLEQPEKEPTL